MTAEWALGSGDVHIWQLVADNPADAREDDASWRLLSDEERGRADRFRFAADRRRFVLGHAALRLILARYTGAPAAQLSFETNPHGRPELAIPAGTGLRFNLSHTRGLIALAVCHHHDIGVDVERVVPRGPGELLRLASQVFSHLEVQALLGRPEEERERRFFQLWTLKEAYIKARGIGLSVPLRAFSFDLADGSRPAIRIDPALQDEAGAWRCLTAQPTGDHWLAVAVRAQGENPRFGLRTIALSDLR